MNRWCVVLLVIATTTLPVPAVAQVVDADRLEQQFRDLPVIRSRPGVRAERFEDENIPKAAAEQQYFLSDIIVRGLSVVPDEIIEREVSTVTGRIVTGDEVARAVGAIINASIDRGYPYFDYETTPEVDPNTGNVTLLVSFTEAFIERVEVKGELHDIRGYFDYYAEAVKAERPISQDTLERYTGLASDLPGFDTGSTLASSNQTPGGLILIYEVKDERPVTAEFTIDNRGTDAVGPVQISGEVVFGNTFGLYDETTLEYVNASFSDELNLFAVKHVSHLHPSGTTLELTGRYTTSTPGTATLKLLEFESESITAGLKVRHPFIRTRTFNVYGELGADARESESRALGSVLTDDKLRSIRVAVVADRTNESVPEGSSLAFVDQAVLRVSQGLSIFGAENNNPNASRADGRTDYTKATAYVATAQNLGGRLDVPELNPFTLKLAGFGQIANDALLSAEECGLGGASFGRAFDSSELTGDHCLMGSVRLEIDTQIPFSTDTVTPYAFFDGGQVWNEGSFQNDGSLASTGIGVEFELFDYFDGYIEFALPLTRGVASDNNSTDPRIFISLTGEF